MSELQDLAIRIAQFNFAPMLYAHPSWLPEDMKKAAALDPEKKCTSAQKTMSNYLLKLHGLDKAFDFDFSDPNKRAALLSADKLNCFFTALGTVLNSDSIRRIVKGSDLRELKKWIDPDHYRLALNNPLLLILKSSAFDVFRAPIPKDNNWQAWAEVVGDMGMKLAAYVFRRQSEPFTARLCLKFSKDKSLVYNQACREALQCKPSLAEMVFSYTLKGAVGESI